MVLVGSFLQAYGNGAFALARVTGYRVRRKQRKWGEVLTCGFPAIQFDRVRLQVYAAGGEVEQEDDKTYLFRGLDGTPDQQMVCEPAPKPKPEPKPQTQYATTENLPAACGYGWLAEAVRAYNLSQSTQMDAMLFISTLQHRLTDADTTTSSACSATC